MPPRDDEYEDDGYDDRRDRRDRRRERDDDRRDRRPAPKTNGVALAGLVTGVVSLILPPLGVVALILSGVGLVRAKPRGGSGKGQAIGGLATGVVGLFVVGPAMIGALLVYSVSKVQEATGRVSAQAKQADNFKQIGLAAHNFEDASGSFPPTAPLSPDGKPPTDPASRLGVRYVMLPYMEQDALFRSLDPAEAWDSPKNRPGSSTPVQQYADPADGPPTNQTRVRGFTGGGAFFDPDPRRTRLSIADGTSNTILFVEAAQTVPWAQNNELPFTPAGPLPPLSQPGRNVFFACMVDGRVQVVRKDVNPVALRAAITYKGGEQVLPLE